MAGLQRVLRAHAHELVAHLERAPEPIIWITRERLEHDRIELGRAVLVERRRRHDVAALDLHQGLVLVLAREQRPRGEQLVQDHAARPHIRARIEIATTGDGLGRHVRELALHATGLRAELR